MAPNSSTSRWVGRVVSAAQRCRSRRWPPPARVGRHLGGQVPVSWSSPSTPMGTLGDGDQAIEGPGGDRGEDLVLRSKCRYRAGAVTPTDSGQLGDGHPVEAAAAERLGRRVQDLVASVRGTSSVRRRHPYECRRTGRCA